MVLGAGISALGLAGFLAAIFHDGGAYLQADVSSLMVVGGLFTYASGQFFDAFRDMAINSFNR